MPATVYHSLSMTTPDDPAYENKPSDWNKSHLFTLNAAGSEISGAFGNGGGVTFGLSADGKITASVPAGGGGLTNINVSAGTTSNNLSALTFNNANGITFGLDASTITASHNGLTSQSNQAFSANGGSSAFQTLGFSDANGVTWSNSNGSVVASYSQSTHSHSTAPGGIAAGTQTATSGTVVFANSNGITFGMSNSSQVTASYTVPSTAGLISAVNVSAGTTSNNLSALTFSNANGVSFGLNASTVTATVATTYRASNDAIGLNTAQSNVTWTVNSSGLSLDARGYAGTGTSATNASITLNSNGLAISVNAGGVSQTGPNIADGNGNTITSGTVVFSNSNGVSFGLNGSTMTASVDAGGGGIAIGAGGATATSGTVVFSNSNNITFGLNNNTLTASFADPYESIYYDQQDFVTTIGAPINGTASIVLMDLGHNLKATRLDFMGSVSAGTSNNTSSAAILWSATGVLYSQNAGTLSSIASATTASQVTWNSNSTSSVSGARLFSVPLTVSTDQGYYFLAVHLSTRATGQTGAATTSLGNTISMMGAGSAQFGAFSVAEFGVNTASSGSWFGGGLYSGTTNFATIAMSNISRAGTFGNRAKIAVRMWST